MSELGANARVDQPSSAIRERSGARVAPAKDSIASWLDLFCTLMRVPPRERDEARAELESHLRDRARDFMLAGLDAEDAARRAIAEVGEAAELAARYRATRVENQRRNAMQFTGIGLAAGAAVVSIAALFNSQGAGRPPAPQAIAPAAQGSQDKDVEANVLLKANSAGSDDRRRVALQTGRAENLLLVTPTVQLAEDVKQAEADRREEIARLRSDIERQKLEQAELERRVTAQAVHGDKYQPMSDNDALMATTFDGDLQDVPISEVLDMLAKAGSTPGVVHRAAIDEAGLKVDNPFTGHFKKTSVSDVIAALNERLAVAPEASKLDARVTSNGAIEIGTRGLFDRRETSLVAYDLGAVLGDVNSRSQTRDAVVMSIMQIVYPDGWKSNGGDYAELHMVNDTMFVRAPARYHHSIRWVISQLRPVRRAAAPAGMQGVQRIPLKRLDATEIVGDGMSQGGLVKLTAIPSQNTVVLSGDSNAVTNVADDIKRQDELANQRADAAQAK